MLQQHSGGGARVQARTWAVEWVVGDRSIVGKPHPLSTRERGKFREGERARLVMIV